MFSEQIFSAKKRFSSNIIARENNFQACELGKHQSVVKRYLLPSIACSEKLILTVTFAFSFANVYGCCGNLHFKLTVLSLYFLGNKVHLIMLCVHVCAYLHPLAFVELLSCFDPNLTEK